MGEAIEMRPCDICILNDRDYTPKECTYCGPCKVWKCKKCLTDPVRTINAFVKKHGGKLFG